MRKTARSAAIRDWLDMDFSNRGDPFVDPDTGSAVEPLDEASAIEALSALAQATRLGVFRMLMAAFPQSVQAGEIASRLAVPHNTMSVHLRILQRAGLCTVQRQGRMMLYRADVAGFAGLMRFMAGDCCAGRPDLCGVAFPVDGAGKTAGKTEGNACCS
ncbi:helix-turn-helix domain-containing protein [Zavarzinia compransoris]|uniref:ArsR/SmtB family transcription factor n=1 Tax=Zavarzinia marina TaxID=2911065 RepID=UPI001F21045C|nr:helix-turn-helix domain-containing protein [Zavarzinia marina]MCF4165639.1 helix-turn-helix domain-containing protein [Zavarzinia marina]